jgi:hypothetical protein
MLFSGTGRAQQVLSGVGSVPTRIIYLTGWDGRDLGGSRQISLSADEKKAQGLEIRLGGCQRTTPRTPLGQAVQEF